MNSADRINLAVIGVGHHGRQHARIFSNMADVALQAIVDLNRDRAREVAGEFSTQAECDYRKIIDKIDAVSIAVPAQHQRFHGWMSVIA